MALDTLRLLASCPDRPGIISTVSGFLYERGANIVRSDQYTSDDGTFYLRMEFTVPTGHRVDLVETYGLAVANPYGMSWRVADSRYVKRIAIPATAHYVTEDLDEGPIIEQDVIRVSHRDDTARLVRLGADVERTVLARAVQWHCEDRLLRHRGTVVVF